MPAVYIGQRLPAKTLRDRVVLHDKWESFSIMSMFTEYTWRSSVLSEEGLAKMINVGKPGRAGNHLKFVVSFGHELGGVFQPVLKNLVKNAVPDMLHKCVMQSTIGHRNVGRNVLRTDWLAKMGPDVS